jgi:hypothetical protein
MCGRIIYSAAEKQIRGNLIDPIVIAFEQPA